MRLSAELLDTAVILNRAQPATQGNLRRAVSTAYYSLFHRIIESACGNWPLPQRGKVARQFDHRRMKDASDTTAKRLSNSKLPLDQDLFFVTAAFVELQARRHEADYDVSATFSSTDVEVLIASVRAALEAWERLKDQTIAHDYLFSLLFKERS